MRVNVERIREIKEELRAINKKDLNDIEFFENGVELDIDKKTRDEFVYCGLNNTDFITTGIYNASKKNDSKISNYAGENAYYHCNSCGIELTGEDVSSVPAGDNKANGEFAPCPECESENSIDRGEEN